jgi:hypothetical protein
MTYAPDYSRHVFGTAAQSDANLLRRKPPKSLIWRKGWDSNPRYSNAVHRISNATELKNPPNINGPPQAAQG